MRRSGVRTLHLLVAASEWVTGETGESSCVLTLLDIMPLKAAQARVEHMAKHDALTGLGNRSHFGICLAEALRLPERLRGAADRPGSLQGTPMTGTATRSATGCCGSRPSGWWLRSGRRT